MESTDNERIKAIYGNYNFWSWLRYWYLDTSNIVTMLLIDKGYFDYDFEKVQGRVLMDNTIKSDEEVSSLMRKFGIGQKKLSAEDLQNMARREIEGNT